MGHSAMLGIALVVPLYAILASFVIMAIVLNTRGIHLPGERQ